MSFYHDPSTNVALPLFEPGYTGQYVSFDSSDQMYVTSNLDDTVTPPNSLHNHKLYRWYVCETNFEGYVYKTLSWVLGKSPPENPSCTKIEVVRVFL